MLFPDAPVELFALIDADESWSISRAEILAALGLDAHGNPLVRTNDVDWSGTLSAADIQLVVNYVNRAIDVGRQQDETIPAVLERELLQSNSDRPMTVVNAGIAGYGPWQSSLLLREKGFALDPDLVILQLYVYNDNPRFLGPLWEVPGCVHERRGRATARLRLSGLSVRETRALAASPFAVGIALKRENVLLEFVRSFRFVPELPRPPLPTLELRREEIETEIDTSYPELKEGWALFGRDVSAIAEKCRQRNVPFLVYAIPGLPMFDDGVWEKRVAVCKGRFTYERGRTYRAMLDFFACAGLPYDEVLPELASEPDPRSVFFRYSRHLTRKGCEIVGKALAEDLTSIGFLRAPGCGDGIGAGEAWTLWTKWTEQCGDSVHFVHRVHSVRSARWRQDRRGVVHET